MLVATAHGQQNGPPGLLDNGDGGLRGNDFARRLEGELAKRDVDVPGALRRHLNHRNPERFNGNGHYYEIVNDSRNEWYINWYDAKDEAASLTLPSDSACPYGYKGYLATITSQDELDFIDTVLTDYYFESGALWIGLTDAEVEGTFKWITGEPYDFENWSAGEPNNWGGNEDYARFWKNLKWNDVPGTAEGKGYLVEYECACVIEILTVQSATASSIEGDCYRPGRAVDGRSHTRWATPNKSDDYDPEKATEWLLLDLGGVRFIDSIEIHWERAYSRSYKVEVSMTNDEDWVPVGNFPKVTDFDKNVLMNDLGMGMGEDARYVRITSYGGDRNYGISIKEVKIMGDKHESCVPPLLECRGDEIDGSELFSSIASSTENDMDWLAAVNTIDGKAWTRWASAWEDGQWLAVDLKRRTVITEIEINWENAYALDYDLQVSEDGSDDSWTTVVEIRGSEGAVEKLDFLRIETQFVRLFSIHRATHYGTSIFDFIVHGTQNPSCVAS
jgi:hypothetical protein